MQPSHYQDALALLEKNQIPDLFKLLSDKGAKDYRFNQLRDEFIDGNTNSKYAQRLQTYLQVAFEKLSLANKHLLPVPFQSELFLGRQAELDSIYRTFFEQKQNTLLFLSGQGGIGKTTLASHYYHTHQTQYNFMAWLFVMDNIQDAILRLASPLGIDFGNELNKDTNYNKVLDALRNLPAPCLLVIDNANDKADASTHYQYLRNCPNLHVVCTSRLPAFLHIQMLDVLSLSDTEVIDLFTRHYSKLSANEQPALEDLLTKIGKNTLLIEMIAKNLAYFNKFNPPKYTLSTLLHDIEQGLLRLSKTTRVTTTYRTEPEPIKNAPIEDIITSMYDLSPLTGEEKHLLSVFAILPAERISYTLLETLYPYDTLHHSLTLLVEKGWIEQTEQAGETMLKPYPAVQDVTRAKNQDAFWKDNIKTVGILYHKLTSQDYAGNLTNTTYEEALLYIPIAEHCVSLVQQTSTLYIYNEEQLFSWIGALCDNVGRFYQSIGNIASALQYYERNLRFTILLYQQYPHNVDYQDNVGVCYQMLGDIYAVIGKHIEALQYYQQQNNNEQTLCTQYPDNTRYQNGLAISHEKLGSVYQALTQYEQALYHYQKDVEIIENLCKQEPTNVDFQYSLSISYEKLGYIYQDMKNVEEALIWYQKQYYTIEQVCQIYPKEAIYQNELAIACQHIGNAYIEKGETKQAKPYYECYYQIEQILYEDSPHIQVYQFGLAHSYTRLGYIAETEQAIEKTKKYYTLAQQHFQTLVKQSPEIPKYQECLKFVEERLQSL